MKRTLSLTAVLTDDDDAQMDHKEAPSAALLVVHTRIHTLAATEYRSIRDGT